MTDLSTAWRPFEQTAENQKAAERERERGGCNRHRDCAAAERAHFESFGTPPSAPFHCHSDDCEECFGC